MISENLRGRIGWTGVYNMGVNRDIFTNFCKFANYKEHSFCKDPEFLTQFCQMYPVQVFKLDRVNLEVMEPFLTDPEIGSLLRILLVVRDPRAVFEVTISCN